MIAAGEWLGAVAGEVRKMTNHLGTALGLMSE